MTDFGALNWSILIVYVIGNLYLGYVLGKMIDSAEDFFLGRRTTPWWAIGISAIFVVSQGLGFIKLQTTA